MTFASLGLCEPLLNALTQQGYTQPSPIQQQAIAPVLAGRDVMAAAQTGTGKTAAFTLPLLHKLSLDGQKVAGNKVRALVLTPTRELAAQVADSVTKYGAELRLNYNVVFGGVKINPQMMKLRKGSDVLIATPGRLLDLHQQNAVAFDQLETLVLDEADRMLDMGFIHDVKKILRLLPKKRQNLLFSATFSDEVRSLAQQFVVNPVEVSVTPANTTVDRIDQCIHPVDKNKKTRLLVHLISSENWTQVLVFCRTKHGANRLTNDLIKKGISAAAIHGNKSQNVRTKALADFKQNNIQVLVATDIAARGIDIQQLPHVVNYDLPNVAEDYVHRIGRTGRAGQSGEAVSLVCLAESEQLAIIERFIQLAIPRREVEGYAPSQPLPEVALKPAKPKKPKKPKKHRQGQPEDNSGRQRAKGEQQERGHGGKNSGRNSGKNSGKNNGKNGGENNRKNNSRNSGRNSGKGGGNSGQPSPASDAKEQGQKKNNPAKPSRRRSGSSTEQNDHRGNNNNKAQDNNKTHKPRRRRPAARGNGAGNKANGANSNSVRSGEAKPNSHNN